MDVQEALHVVGGVDKKWNVCSDYVEYSKVDFEASQIDLYVELIKRAKEENINLKMMVFSGDDDSVCSMSGTQSWIWDLGVKPLESSYWKPWFANGQGAGYATDFDLGEGSGSSFSFVTVHGAGHEVPAYKP